MIGDFQSSYKVLLFGKTLPRGNFRQYNGDPLNIIIISPVFYGDRDIKMGHSIFSTILKKVVLQFVRIFISNIAGNIF